MVTIRRTVTIKLQPFLLYTNQISLNIVNEVNKVDELDKGNMRKTTYGGRQTSMEHDLRWKTTLCGRWPSVEDDLWWKTTFGGRRSLVEDDFWWKETFSGRRPLVEDDLQWKATFGKTFDWRHPLRGRLDKLEAASICIKLTECIWDVKHWEISWGYLIIIWGWLISIPDWLPKLWDCFLIYQAISSLYMRFPK